MHLNNFLLRVLPTEGYKCWVEISRQKKVIQGFVATHDELAAKLIEIDARGSDAYFACATYRTTDNRRQVNALCAQALWLDIDTKETKPNAAYDTADDAVQACDDFCNRLDLPLPGVVRSGGGIHAYWPFAAPLDADTWTRLAIRFKQITEASGLHADPARTADIASILRPPGTRNYKDAQLLRMVAIEGNDGFEPSDPIIFIERILRTSAEPRATQRGGSDAAATSNAAFMAGTGKAFDPSKGVAQGTRGSTQLKYAGELVAKGYDEAEVIRLCREWNQRCTPPQDDAEVLRIVKSAFSMHARKHPAVVVPAEWVPPAMPHGFKINAARQMTVEVEEPGANGEPQKTVKIMADYPVYPRVFLNQEGCVRRNSYLFETCHPLAGWYDFCLNAEVVNGRDLYTALVENGVSLPSGMDKYFRIYVREAERMLRREQEVVRYNQFGWKGDCEAFLVGDVLMKGGNPTRAYGTDKLKPLMRTMALPAGGSLEAWTAQADKFFAPGMEAHGFALLTSFAAPLMKFVAGLGDGGSILSLLSDDSGTGKTPLSEAIGSVWGDLDATRVTGNFTANRLIAEVVRRCHLPQVEEEMTISDPTVAAENVKKFTTGTDRARLDRSGAGAEIPEHYQTILISISNTSLHDMVKLVDRAAARRIFELDMERPDNKVFANLGGITKEMMRNRAFAGRRWAQILTSPGVVDWLRENLTGVSANAAGPTIMRYRAAIKSEAEHRFIVWLLAAVDIAGRLLVHYGVLHFDVDRIMYWAIEQAGEKVETGDKPVPDSHLQRFLGEHVNQCLVVSGPFIKGGDRPIIEHIRPHNKCCMRLELSSKRLYIANDALQRWCTANRIQFIKFGKQLVKQNILLERSRNITLGAGTMVPTGRCLCWEIDMSHPSMSGILQDATEEVEKLKSA